MIRTTPFRPHALLTTHNSTFTIRHNYCLHAKTITKNIIIKRNNAMATQTLTNIQQSRQQLIQDLIECAFTCEQCAAACLNEENTMMFARCIELDRDCADICMLASRLVVRDSEITPEFLGVCESMCRTCAEECSKHNHDHCKACAEACLSCAEACRSVIGTDAT